MKSKKLLLGGAMLAISAVSYGQFTLSGEIRPRTEFRHGYKAIADSNQANAVFTDQRSRLNFEYQEEGYKVKLVLQDVRVWGSTKQLNTSDAFSSIHEAWGQAFLTDNWSLKFGRQEIIYDDHRIFGNVGWTQQARSHDAVQVKYKKDKMKLDITGAYNQDKAGLTGTSALVGSYKAFQSIWFHNDFGDNLKVSFLFLNNGKQVNDAATGKYWDNYTQTIGTHTKYKMGKFSTVFNGYYQMGKTNEVLARDVSAYLVGLDLNYKISDKFTTTLGFEMQSGQSQTDTSKAYTDVNRSFTPFYGTNHKFNGFMDYFYVGNWGNSVGLQDIYAKFKYKKDKSFIGLDVHMFSAIGDVLDGYKVASDLADAAAAGTPLTDVNTLQKMNKNLGTEIDLTIGTQLSKGVTLKAGFSHMLGTKTLAYMKGAIDYKGEGRADDHKSNWAYLMIIFKPTFLKVDKKVSK